MGSLKPLLIIWLIFFGWISSALSQDSLLTIFTEEQIPEISLTPKAELIILDSNRYLKLDRKDPFKVSGEKFIEVNSSSEASFNQGFILDIQGKINDSTVLMGHLSDQQNTLSNGNRSSTLREFDQVQLRIINPHWEVHLGDIPIQYEMGERGKWSQWIRGVDASWNPRYGKTHSSIGIAPTEFQRIRFQTSSSQQGGYLLGTAGELNAIQPGSLKLWLDGVLMQEGIDFQVDYFEATLDFLPRRLIQAQQWVEVEYQWLDTENATQFTSLSQELLFNDANVGAWVFHKSLQNDSVSLSHSWSGITESTPIISNLWQRSELEEVDLSGAITHRGSFEIFDGKSLYTRTPGLGYSIKYFVKDSNFIDLNQSSDLGSKWMSWRISQSTQQWNESAESFSVRVNPSESWFQLFNYNKLILSKNDSLIEGDKWEYELKSDLGIFHQEINYDYLNLTGDLNYREKNFQMNPWLELGNWTYGIMSHGIERSSDSLFFEAMIKPRVSYESQLGRTQSLYEFTYNNRRIRWRDQIDSLYTQSWSIVQEFHHEYDLLIKNQFHYQKEREELYQNDERETWLGYSSAQYWNKDAALQGEYHYRLENTLGKYRVPLYREVPQGTGNVAFDSITGSYIEEVERGDFILQGWVNDTTQEYQLQKKIHFDSHLKVNVKNLFGVNHGFLAHSQIGWILQLSTIDTANSIEFWPAHSTAQYNKFYEASQHQDLYYEFNNSKHQVVYWRSWFYQSSQGLNLVEESEMRDRLTMSYTILKGLKLMPEIMFIRHDINEVGNWKKDQYRFEIDHEWPRNFHHQPYYELATGDFNNTIESREMNLKKIGMRWEYYFESSGLANIEISQINLNNDNLPFSLTEGYKKGLSYEGQINGHVKLTDNFFCDLNYLVIQDGSDLYQRMSLQTRAVF